MRWPLVAAMLAVLLVADRSWRLGRASATGHPPGTDPADRHDVRPRTAAIDRADASRTDRRPTPRRHGLERPGRHHRPVRWPDRRQRHGRPRRRPHRVRARSHHDRRCGLAVRRRPRLDRGAASRRASSAVAVPCRPRERSAARASSSSAGRRRPRAVSGPSGRLATDTPGHARRTWGSRRRTSRCPRVPRA